MTSRERALIVGEAPGPTENPTPMGGRVGARLEHLGHFAPGSLSRHFDLANLLDRWPGAAGKGSLFPAAEAREAAKKLAALLSGEPAHRRVILLGKRVAAAFGERRLEPFRWVVRSFGGREVEIALFPHPSGVNRFFNDPANVAAAGEFLFAAAALKE